MWTPRKRQGATARFDSGQTRAHVTLDVSRTVGDRVRGGAAVSGLAGARRLHLSSLREEAYLSGMVSLRGATGVHAGDESLRRWSTASTAPAIQEARRHAKMSGG